MPIAERSDGETIDETWFNLLKDAIEALEAVNVLAFTGLAIDFEVFGPSLSTESSYIGFMYHRVTQDVTVLSATLHNITAGSAGSLQCDVQRKRGGGAFVSLFTTKPSIPYTAGSGANSDTGTGATAAVIDSTVDELLEGDILRFDMNAVQTAGAGALLSLYIEPTGV